jgi:hypothetical protein
MQEDFRKEALAFKKASKKLQQQVESLEKERK